SRSPPSGILPPPVVGPGLDRAACRYETGGMKREAPMNLHRLLQKRMENAGPVRVGLIGAGKFGSMFLSQVPTTPGIEVTAIADLAPDRAREACRRVGWDDARIAATRFTDDTMTMLRADDVDVVVEATGHAPAGIAHARRAIAEGKHIVMVNVEAD